MSQSHLLPPGKLYHFNVIYNHANSPLDATEDNLKSLQYAEETVSRLSSVGFDKNYYHKRDAGAGRNIFDELFRVIRQSEYTLVILTPGFLKNEWANYSRQAAFKQLLDKAEAHRLIALAFGLTSEMIPQELCHHHVLHFLDADENEDVWLQLIQEMGRSDEDDRIDHPPVNEYGDNRVYTSDGALIAHPEEESRWTVIVTDQDWNRRNTYLSEENIRVASDHARDSAKQTGISQVDIEPSIRVEDQPRKVGELSRAGGTYVQRPSASDLRLRFGNADLDNTFVYSDKYFRGRFD